MEKFSDFNQAENLPEEKSGEQVSESITEALLKNNPELAEIYSKRSGKEKIVIDESGQIVSEGQTYTNNEKMRSLVELAHAIREQLPGVQDGYVRLWRGNRQDEVGHNPSYTNSLEGIALPFLRGYGGVLSYVDIRKEDAEKYLSTGAVAKGSEFILPGEIVKDAKIVGIEAEQEDEIKRKAKPLAPTQGNGWESV